MVASATLAVRQTGSRSKRMPQDILGASEQSAQQFGGGAVDGGRRDEAAIVRDFVATSLCDELGNIIASDHGNRLRCAEVVDDGSQIAFSIVSAGMVRSDFEGRSLCQVSPSDQVEAAYQHVEGHREDQHRESGRQRTPTVGERPCRTRANQAAEQASCHEEAGERPVHQSGPSLATRGGQPKCGDRDERRSNGIQDRHPGGQHQRGDDQEAASNTEEP
jgi:hypothetical protein